MERRRREVNCDDLKKVDQLKADILKIRADLESKEREFEAKLEDREKSVKEIQNEIKRLTIEYSAVISTPSKLLKQYTQLLKQIQAKEKECSSEYFFLLYSLVVSLQIKKYLTIQGIVGNNCWNFPDYISNISLPNRDSSSDTRFVLATVEWILSKVEYASKVPTLKLIRSTLSNVGLKISFAKIGDNSLTLERRVYRDIINHMVSSNATPGVVVALASFECPDIISKFREMYPTGLSGEWQSLYNDLRELSVAPGATPNANILIMERIAGPKFATLPRNPTEEPGGWIAEPHTHEEWFSVLFSIYYTLLVFNFYGLRHNDLHLENILVKKGVNATFKFYITDVVYYQVKLQDLPKIYDFDFAATNPSYPSLPQYKEYNRKLDEFCKPYGICNDPNKKFDMFVFTYQLYHQCLSIGQRHVERQAELGVVINFCKLIVNDDLLKFVWPHSGRVCRNPHLNLGRMVCDGNYEPPDNLVLPLTQVVTLPVFNPFRRQNPSYKNLSAVELARSNIFHLPDVHV
jgi:hypothetical protein